jgi:hypothetical protein
LDYFGFNNSATIRGVALGDPKFGKAAAQLKPKTIRFPAGTVANYWDWMRGDFVGDAPGELDFGGGLPKRSCVLPSGYHLVDPPAHDLASFAKQIQATGAMPVFVLSWMCRSIWPRPIASGKKCSTWI